VQKLGVLVSPLRAHRPPVVLAQPSASPANILARALFHIDPEHLHAVPYTSSPCAPTSHNQCFAADHGFSSSLLMCFAAFFFFLGQVMAFPSLQMARPPHSFGSVERMMILFPYYLTEANSNTNPLCMLSYHSSRFVQPHCTGTSARFRTRHLLSIT
jgi:hypothetical protein